MQLQTCSRLRASIVAVTLFCASAAMAQQPSLSRQEILLELALTQKMLADEQYLNLNLDAAEKTYQAAMKIAEKLDPASGLVAESDVSLIRSEIDYRLKLLQSGSSFWGLSHQLRPANPVASLKRLNEVISQFRVQVADITQDVEALGRGGTGQVATELKTLETAENSTVQSLQSQAEATKLRHAELRRQMLRDRMDAIMSRQAEIAAKREDLDSQMSSAAAGLNQMLLDAVTTYAGLPPNTMELVESASKGQVEGVLKTAVTSYLASNTGAEMKGDFGKFVGTVKEVSARYKEIKGNVNKVQESAKDTLELMRALQSGNTQNILKAGAEVFDHLPDQTKDQITKSLASQKTVSRAVALARQGSELRAKIADYIDKAPDLGQQIGGLFDRYLNVAEDEFDRRYSETLASMLAHGTTAVARQDAFIRLAQAWPKTFVDDVIDEKDLVAAARALGGNCTAPLNCRDWLIEKFKAKIPATPAIRVTDAGIFTIADPSGRQIVQSDLKGFADKTLKRPVEVAKVSLATEARSLAGQVSTLEKKAKTALLSHMPDVDFDRAIAPLLNAIKGPQETAALRAISPTDSASDPLIRGMASLSIGRDVSESLSAPPPTIGPPKGPQRRPPDQDKAGPDAATQAALAAVASSGPYGAAAVMALKMLSSLEAFGDLADQANRLDSEDRGLTAELLHLAPLEIDIQRDEGLASLAKRIADTKVLAAERRGGLLRSSLRDQGAHATALELRIRSRLPLTYFLAELLREQYDQLDRSLAFWTDGSAQSPRHIESRLRQNPANLRLALDPDIRLFDWFDRSAEGQRKDLAKLEGHWTRVKTVVDDHCARSGCAPGVAELGSVFRTTSVRLSVLDERALVRTPSTQQVQVTVLPRHFPGLPDLDRLRVVEIAGVVRKKSGGAPSSPVDFRVRHSGLGYLLIGDEGRREVLDASDDTDLRYLSSDDALELRRTGLQGRWRGFDGLQTLEGYPLFGLYEISIPQSFDPAVDDLELVFFYQRPSVRAMIEARRPPQSVDCRGSKAGALDEADVRLVRRKNGAGIFDAIETAANGPQCSIRVE